MERNLDFDTVIDRHHTYSIKYDSARENGMPEDVLPLWVADMDFRVSSYIQDAIRAQTEHGIFGYSNMQEEYFTAVQGWMQRHHGWQVEPQWLVRTPGVVFALAAAVRAFTETGDGVLIQPPIYPPFKNVITDNDRKVVCNPLVLGDDGRYRIDFEAFETSIIKENVKLFLLCNPHNPVGRVWSREELERLGDICCRHQVIVVSDEIHADFVFEGRHQVFADVKEAYRRITVTATAPSKTFNIAGLQASNIFIADPERRRQFEKQLQAVGYHELTIMGMLAAKEAYEHGEEWYTAMHGYVRENIAFARAFVTERLAPVRMLPHEGTYLIWLDFRALQYSDEELNDLLIHKAKLWLDDGEMFGTEGRGFQRVNVACPRKTLTEALKRLETAIRAE